MFNLKRTLVASAAVLVALSAGADAAKYDPRMALEKSVTEKGVRWIDGKLLPIEGRAFDNVDHYYDRLPSNVTAKVNGGVRGREACTDHFSCAVAVIVLAVAGGLGGVGRYQRL